MSLRGPGRQNGILITWVLKLLRLWMHHCDPISARSYPLISILEGCKDLEALCHITDANSDLVSPKLLMATNFWPNNVYGFWDHKAMSTCREATSVWYLQGLEQWWSLPPRQTMLHTPPIQWGLWPCGVRLRVTNVSLPHVTCDITWALVIIMVNACNNANVILWPLFRCNESSLGYLRQ